MKTLITILIATCLVAGFSSCRRDVDESTNNIIQSDSGYIKSLIIINPQFPSPVDTLFKFLFDYDVQKRISRVREYSYEYNSTTQGINFKSEIKFSYNGIDTVPARLFVRATYNSSSWFDTVDLKYNNGMVREDSVTFATLGSPVSFIKFNFQELGNGSWTGNYIDSVPGHQATTHTMRSFVNWQNGNLVAERDTFYNSGVPGNFLSKDFTYDQHPNPLKRAMLNVPTTAYHLNWVTSAHGNWYLRAFVNNSANNILTQLHNPGAYYDTWTYTYRPDGLPVKAFRSNSGGVWDVYYSYTTL
jgi:hypothetical protein